MDDVNNSNNKNFELCHSCSKQAIGLLISFFILFLFNCFCRLGQRSFRGWDGPGVGPVGVADQNAEFFAERLCSRRWVWIFRQIQDRKILDNWNNTTRILTYISSNASIFLYLCLQLSLIKFVDEKKKHNTKSVIVSFRN